MKYKLVDTHYRKTDLLNRGWNRVMIDKYLGEPDLKTPWTYNTICWYEKGRVERAERTSEVVADLRVSQQRREAWHTAELERQRKREEREQAERVAEKCLRRAQRREERRDAILVEQQVSQQICVRLIDERELKRRAGLAHNVAAHQARLVDFALRKLTNLGTIMKEYDTYSKPWRYGVIKRLALKAVAQTYPTLSAECERWVQKIERSTKGWVWHRAYY